MRKFFGIDLEEYIPVDVFPFDADYSYRRGRSWTTNAVPFSPILEQRFVLVDSPLVSFEIGFSVLQGDVMNPDTRAGKVWDFFNVHRGRATMFWYFDPAAWSAYPEPYRSDPTQRLHHPSDATKERYIVLFNEDEMTAEWFEYRLTKATLKLNGYPG